MFLKLASEKFHQERRGNHNSRFPQQRSRGFSIRFLGIINGSPTPNFVARQVLEYFLHTSNETCNFSFFKRDSNALLKMLIPEFEHMHIIYFVVPDSQIQQISMFLLCPRFATHTYFVAVFSPIHKTRKMQYCFCPRLANHANYIVVFCHRFTNHSNYNVCLPPTHKSHNLFCVPPIHGSNELYVFVSPIPKSC